MIEKIQNKFFVVAVGNTLHYILCIPVSMPNIMIPVLTNIIY